MIRFGKNLLKLAVLVGIALTGFGTQEARAGLLPTLLSITPDFGGFRYTYDVTLSNTETVNPGDYFTMYDFEGLVGGSHLEPADWIYSTAMLGVTPPKTVPVDSPVIPNITWTYSGPTISFGADASLGLFSAVSVYGGTIDADFSSLTHRKDNGKEVDSLTTNSVPLPHAVPEPGSLTMLGIGLPFLGVFRLVRRRLAVA